MVGSQQWLHICVHLNQMARKYTLKKRAEQLADTRRRIVEATAELHGTVGPASTTLSMIAERAGRHPRRGRGRRLDSDQPDDGRDGPPSIGGPAATAVGWASSPASGMPE